jgi:hypothetical protein
MNWAWGPHMPMHTRRTSEPPSVLGKGPPGGSKQTVCGLMFSCNANVGCALRSTTGGRQWTTTELFTPEFCVMNESRGGLAGPDAHV